MNRTPERQHATRPRRSRPCPRCGEHCAAAALLCFTCWQACPLEVRAVFTTALNYEARIEGAKAVLSWAKNHQTT